MIIRFLSTKIPGFIGENQVPTNAPGSGIYDKDVSKLEEFVQPNVDINIIDFTL